MCINKIINISLTIIIFIIGQIILFMIISFPTNAEIIFSEVDIDQGFYQIADFTVNENITFFLSGNITLHIDDSMETINLHIEGPEGWNNSLSPDKVTVYFGATTFPFEWTIIPNTAAEQGNYNVSLIFKETFPWPSELFRRNVTCRVIQNRIELFCNETEESTYPDSMVTYNLSIKNLGTVSDTFFIEILNVDGLENQGWNFTANKFNITLQPEEEQEVVVQVYVPSNARSGNYSVEVFVNSNGHINSTSSQDIVIIVQSPRSSNNIMDSYLLLIVLVLILALSVVTVFIVMKRKNHSN